MAAHQAVAGDVFDGVLFYFVLSFFHKMYWIRFMERISLCSIPPKKRLDKMFVNLFPA